jgi:hypothetical protein
VTAYVIATARLRKALNGVWFCGLGDQMKSSKPLKLHGFSGILGAITEL